MTTRIPDDARRDYLRARVAALRAALDLLWTQVEKDRGEPFHTIGRGKVELISMEMELFRLDRVARERTWATCGAHPDLPHTTTRGMNP
jgi:hypothetical protein